MYPSFHCAYAKLVESGLRSVAHSKFMQSLRLTGYDREQEYDYDDGQIVGRSLRESRWRHVGRHVRVYVEYDDVIATHAPRQHDSLVGYLHRPNN